MLAAEMIGRIWKWCVVVIAIVPAALLVAGTMCPGSLRLSSSSPATDLAGLAVTFWGVEAWRFSRIEGDVRFSDGQPHADNRVVGPLGGPFRPSEKIPPNQGIRVDVDVSRPGAPGFTTTSQWTIEFGRWPELDSGFRIIGVRFDRRMKQVIFADGERVAYLRTRGQIPHWLLMAPAGVLVLRSAAARLSARRRAAQGRCLACGYDLRESQARCPECGTTRSAA